ncbi:hypothetical protein FOZ63_017042 [Perkinsus olseni]|uniref:Uncharacterized protein n=1 Tax=Perkinsus olseni TaxID=32597 RepID=A0A7J6TVQ1_PEROL|nr:hypothetical protein FOZ63_017042 [Perkinsus olseni]
MAESVPLRIGSVHRRGRFFVEEAVDSEGVAASHIYHTRVSYRDCCGVAGDASTTAGSVCGDASVKSTTSVNAPTAECGYMSSSSTASSAAIEPLRIRRVGRFLCDCFPEQAQDASPGARMDRPKQSLLGYLYELAQQHDYDYPLTLCCPSSCKIGSCIRQLNGSLTREEITTVFIGGVE